MNGLKKFIYSRLAADELPFDSRLLNFVCLFGAIACVVALISRLIAGLPFISMAPLLLMIAAIFGVLLMSVKNTANTEALTALIVSSVGIIFFPVIFFTIGGPGSGMAVYFSLAIILDFSLLKGKARIFTIVLTVITTVLCYVSTLFWGWSTLLENGLSNYQFFIDIMQSILVVGFLMGLIISFQLELSQNERNKAEAAVVQSRQSESLLTLINESALTLLTAEFDKFESTISKSMEKIALCLNIDCIDIWRSSERDGEPVYMQLYGWLSPSEDKTKTYKTVSGTNLFPRVAEWDDKLFSSRGYMSDQLDNFSGRVHDLMSICGIKAIMSFPVFLHGKYWGFVSFENRHSEELCSDWEAAILQSGSLLLANSVERNESILQLNRVQRSLSAMFEANPHINILFDSKFKVVECNPAAYKFMGFDSKEDFIEGFIQRISISIPSLQPDGRPSIPLSDRLITAVKEGQVKFETELHLSGDIARNLSVEFKKIPYGESFAVVGYVYDMTEMYQREMELRRRDLQLREAIEEARAASLAKSNFLATMSHEIRTPMNAILGITEIQLQNETLDQDVKDAFNKIGVSGDMLLGIINDILDLSKIEAGKLELSPGKYEIASLISDTAQLNMMRIGSKPIEFELSVDENVPAVLLGDELRVKQIINNVLSNAFKYTHEGLVKMSVAAAGVDGDAGAGAGVTAAGEGGGAGVTAAGEGGGGEAISAAGVMSGGGGVNSGGSASSSGASADTTTLIICVSDTGQGMTKENVEKLFDEYSRFGEGTNRSTEGTGLGMSITQKLLHLMNGKIHVESEIGKGSKFTVYIPQERIGSEVLGKEVANNLHNFRSNSRAQMRRVQITRESMPYGSVLIVDDVETNIYVAKGLLAPYELKIDSADSGIAAIEQIKRGREYDIVFMDHMMPKMDGIEATKIIRSMGYNRPIVALTANAVSGQADVFLGNGFDDFISKPIDIRQLNAVLNRLIRDRHPREAVYAAKQHVKSSKNHSFEDSAAVQQVIDPRFSEVFIRDASKALSALESISDKSNYDQEDNMRIYIINVHGIKSALASIGNKELSSQALELEIAAREGDLEKLKADTPAFLYSLRSFRDKLISQTAPAASGSNETVEDKTYLREKLLAIKGACEEYDDNVADETLAELKNAKWSKKTLDLLSTIAEQLLHSEFDDAVETINNYIELL